MINRTHDQNLGGEGSRGEDRAIQEMAQHDSETRVAEKLTTDPDEIKEWAERYGGRPELIDDPQAKADQVSIRINFPGSEDDRVSSRLTKPIEWAEFFEQFERLSYAFSYRDTVEAREHPSEAFHFVPRDNVPQDNSSNL